MTYFQPKSETTKSYFEKVQRLGPKKQRKRFYSPFGAASSLKDKFWNTKTRPILVFIAVQNCLLFWHQTVNRTVLLSMHCKIQGKSYCII